MSPHTHLARSPVGLADKVWLEAVGPRARREQPVVSLARSGAEAQTGHRDIDPARVAESCSQRRHRGRCADAPSWVHDWKARLGCDAGEGVGRSQRVIVVRDDLGVLEIFANQFESKAETAHKIFGLAQKWQIGDWMIGCCHPLSGTKDWMGPPTLRYQGNVDGPLVPSTQGGCRGRQMTKHDTSLARRWRRSSAESSPRSTAKRSTGCWGLMTPTGNG